MPHSAHYLCRPLKTLDFGCSKRSVLLRLPAASLTPLRLIVQVLRCGPVQVLCDSYTVDLPCSWATHTSHMHTYTFPCAPLQVRCESDPVHWLCHVSDEAARRLGDLQRSAEEAGLDLQLPQSLHR